MSHKNAGTGDVRKAANAAGLQYVHDDRPGISRIGRGGHFRFLRPDRSAVRDRATLKRIAALAIPPAWKRVWISPSADGHLQATGRDARGRKQYRYHPDFVAVRDQAKYHHLVEFALGLPALRRRLKKDLKLAGLPRRRILAALVSLLEHTLIRIGNEDYVRQNNSFGLTTLRNRHAVVKGAQIRFLFQGKSGKRWSLALRDRRVARIIKSCQELPGQHLFEYQDKGAIHAITSSDVNAYLQEISGKDITAKDFRTWAGTVKAAIGLHAQKDAGGKKVERAVIADVAAELGNTVAICRKCYIHPAVLEAFEEDRLSLRFPARARGGLSGAEQAVLGFLRRSPRK